MNEKLLIIFAVVIVLQVLWIVNTPVVQTVTTTERDTTVTTDTLIVRDTFTVKADPLPPDTVYKAPPEDTLGAARLCKQIREYTTPFSDSLLEGSIHTRVQGKLLEQSIDYTPLFPLQITTTQRITQATRISNNKYKFLVGVGVSKDFIAPTLGLQAPHGHIVSLGYNSLQDSPYVALHYNLNRLFQ